jgi:hypothetical protein
MHQKVTRIAGRGQTSALIVECLEEVLPNRYKKWLKAELEAEEHKVYDSKHENGQGTVRRSSTQDGENLSTKNIRDKKREKGSGKT